MENAATRLTLSPPIAAQAPAPMADHNPVQLVCAEVWGGNRPIDAPIELPGIRGQIFSQPCDGGRGGDVHYLATCGSGLLSRIVVADVAGHGEKVAGVSSQLHRLLRRHMNQPDQRNILAQLNTSLVAADDAPMTTVAAVTYYPPQRSLSISYAGHPPAWLWRRAVGRWTPVEITRKPGPRHYDMPLAVVPELRFSRHITTVEPGDRLLLLTDGVLEAAAPGGEQFGADRLARLLNESPRDNPTAVQDLVLEALRQFTVRREFGHDDVTLLSIEFTPGPPGPALWHVFRNRILQPRGNRPEAALPPA